MARIRMFLLAAVVCGGVGYTYSGKLARLMPGWEVISWAVLISLPLSSSRRAAVGIGCMRKSAEPSPVPGRAVTRSGTFDGSTRNR